MGRPPLDAGQRENAAQKERARPRPPLPPPPPPPQAKKALANKSLNAVEGARAKILPRKSIGTIHENRELNYSEEIIEIKDEPMEEGASDAEVNNCGRRVVNVNGSRGGNDDLETNDRVFKKPKLSGASENSLLERRSHLEHGQRENRPDSPIRT